MWLNYLTRLSIPLLCLIDPCAIHAESEVEVRVSRYSTVQSSPLPSQADVLSLITSITFDQNIHTVGDAVEHLLSDYGYELSDAASDDARSANLLTLKLPEPHRQLGPLSIRQMLQTLTGPTWVVVEDPMNRRINFERCM